MASKVNTAASKTEKNISEATVVRGLVIRHVHLRVVGDSNLVVHAWAEKSKQMIRDKQAKKAKGGKEIRSPEAEYEAAFYRMPEGSATPYGFPSVAFKSVIVGAARWSDGMKMTELRGALHVEGDLVPIFGTPIMREDMVRVGMGSADLRYRPDFGANWWAILPIRYNASAISLEQIVYLLNLGGFGIGVGEFRPEKNGSWGQFHVATEEE